MSGKTHKIWLKISSILSMLYAALFFLGSIPKTKGAIEFVLDISSWPFDNVQNYDANTTEFLSAISGGILFGWAILIWLLSSKIYDLAPEQVRKIVLISLLSWFVVDSSGSIFSGNSNNAVTNIFLLIILVGPLWVPAKNIKYAT
ncbi:hypothetical protein FEE95_17050 [Maribacter algarum]|uniref:Uncharacterized protein n=1 Tax=Maribacter algarum (ex Zhang et al. 2020) TaxID=2578118 RepID=A0A5S3PH63_9FLAO|nr:hypothetical protein [Maribacter algarum]TMM53610.1 hypothetical protein FEE95_17050 [Maribacter algarum]